MAFKDFFIKRTETSAPVNIPQPPKKEYGSNLYNFDMTRETSQLYQLQRTSRGYLPKYSPQALNTFYGESPLNGAIINLKTLLTAGNGYSVDTSILTTPQKISLNQLTNQFDSMLTEVGMDYYIHNRICIEVSWNADFTKIVKLERIAPEKIHINEVNEKMEPISFLYNWDWSYYSNYKTKEYKKFSTGNKTDRCQLYFFQPETPGMLLYSDPSYKSCLTWVSLDRNMGIYFDSVINQSANPSMLIQYPYEPETSEERQAVVRDVNNSFAGARAAGRIMINFAPSKELQPTITQLEPVKLNKEFLASLDSIQRQILISHNTNPILLGFKTPGSLGGTDELINAYKMFNASIIQPAQRVIENILNKFININGLGVKLTLNEPNLFQLPVDVSVEAANKENLEKETSAPSSSSTNDVIRGLSGRQHQGLLRIIKQVGTGKLTNEQATVLLSTGYGLSSDDIQSLLTTED